jgi:hypothetical protein
MPRVRVPLHVARLVTRLVVPLVVDYTARPGASARRASRHAARRAARRRLLRLCRASGCLGTSRGSSRGSSCRSSSTTPRVRVPRHVARLVTRLVAPLVVDYFAFAARPGSSARRAARHRLLRLRRATGCLGTSRGSSRGSLRRSSLTTSHMPRVRVPRHVTRPVTRLIVDYSVRRDFVLRPAGSTSATPCVVTTCLAATLALLRVHYAPPRRCLPVASRRPFISTSFPN